MDAKSYYEELSSGVASIFDSEEWRFLGDAEDNACEALGRVFNEEWFAMVVAGYEFFMEQ